jgi:hypothetical protein
MQNLATISPTAAFARARCKYHHCFRSMATSAASVVVIDEMTLCENDETACVLMALRFLGSKCCHSHPPQLCFSVVASPRSSSVSESFSLAAAMVACSGRAWNFSRPMAGDTKTSEFENVAT